MQETRVWSLGWEDSLEKEMATHSSTIAWKIPRTEEPGGLQSMGLQRVGHDWATSLLLSLFINYLCLPRWYSGQESASQCSRWKRLRFNPWVQKNCLEKEMATHSSTLAWKIPWTEDPGGLQSMGLQRVGHYWACARARARTHTHTPQLSWSNWYLQNSVLNKMHIIFMFKCPWCIHQWSCAKP